MLSPATFLGIAKATAAPGPTPPVRPTTGDTAPENSANGVARVQRARVLGSPPLGMVQTPPSTSRPPATIAPNQQTPPPRNLPRGSLLDLSV